MPDSPLVSFQPNARLETGVANLVPDIYYPTPTAYTVSSLDSVSPNSSAKLLRFRSLDRPFSQDKS